jgi:uncharacterized protein (DUF983 family)
VETSKSGTIDDRQDDERPTAAAMLRGWNRRCPACGRASLFNGYLKVLSSCRSCGEELHHHRADDAPPYFTIIIVGHIIVPLSLIAERNWSPDLWLQFLIWLPATLTLTCWFLPRVKGTLIGLQWAARMHGFGDEE